MDDKIINGNFGASKSAPTDPLPEYFDYTITLKDGNVLTDYGYLIANGVIYAVCRGPLGRGELMTCVNAENVSYVRSTGQHSLASNQRLDA